MRIVVSHLTRMRAPQICVAGLTRDAKHVRPVPLEGQLNRGHLLESGGMFALGAVIELGEVEDVGLPPEREDRMFSLQAARHEFPLAPEKFWRHNVRSAKADLVEIFGPELTPVGQTMTVPLGKGQASLGCLTPAVRPRFYVDERGKARARLVHCGTTLSVPVTDIRLYDNQHETVCTDRLKWLNASTARGCLLSLGLGRPFKADWRPLEEHWLQVNNIHPKQDPLWDSAPD
jgi:hypothetical protein